MEWLGDVVIGTGLQAFDLVLPVVARGQNQDGVSLLRGAQSANHLEPGKLRQTKVDNGHIERVLEASENTLLAILRYIDGEASFHQPRFQRIRSTASSS